MTPETKNAVETARQADGKFGAQPRVEVLEIELEPSRDEADLNVVLGRHVKHGGQSSTGDFSHVVNSSGSKPHGGLRFTPTSGAGSFVSLHPDARVLVINSREDFVRAFHAYPPAWGPQGTVGLDYEQIAEDFGALYVTNKGAHDNRESNDGDMYGDLRDWTKGEVLVLRSDAIEDHWR